MERVIDSSRLPPGDADHVGIAIHRGGQHIGVLYRVTLGKPARLLHMAWHNRLCSVSPGAEYVLWIDPAVPRERAMAVAAFCRRIWKKNSEDGLPYGLSKPNRFFDHTGGILKGPAKVGLTCATFVLAVFDTAGLALVQYTTWPQPTGDDIARQRELAERLQKDQQVPREHVRAFRTEIGNIRYRPHEVAGAATSDSLPADHEYAARVATRIKRKLATLSIRRA